MNSNKLYTKENGCGYITFENITGQMKVPELNCGFRFLKEQKNDDMPLWYKKHVDKSGNYKVELEIITKKETVYVFSERRRYIFCDKNMKIGETINLVFNAAVTDFIFREKLEQTAKNESVDVTVFGADIKSIEITGINCPTVFIAGDSTLTDQKADLPFNPLLSFGGWAQVLPMYMNESIAVSNQAVSGLSTKTFDVEGHFGIVKKNIKQGDFFFIQFGHNDQKDETLKPETGYSIYLNKYIDFAIDNGATPVIITSVARNHRNEDGSFKDTLLEYADACKKVALERNVLLIDLHKKSSELLSQMKDEEAVKLFMPDDRTHHNDMGAIKMCELVIEELKKIEIIAGYIK